MNPWRVLSGSNTAHLWRGVDDDLTSSPSFRAGSLAENPDDIFLALRRYCAVQRTVRRTRDQVRRVRFFFHKKPAEAGSCASTQTTNPG